MATAGPAAMRRWIPSKTMTGRQGGVVVAGEQPFPVPESD